MYYKEVEEIKVSESTPPKVRIVLESSFKVGIPLLKRGEGNKGLVRPRHHLSGLNCETGGKVEQVFHHLLGKLDKGWNGSGLGLE